MKYRVRVAGKVFESENANVLLKRAVEARRAAVKALIRPNGTNRPLPRNASPAVRSI